ncbi:hypothetical protein ACHAQH_003935 [Verticillium albo-atrum]
MAELIGLISSSLALAEFGARLSLKLYTLSRTLASAPADARVLASEISLTATVVRELAVLLEADAESGMTASEAAVGAARGAVGECLCVFEEVDALLGQSIERMQGGRGGRAVERMSKIDEEEKAYRRRVIGSLAMLEREMAAKVGGGGLPPYEEGGTDSNVFGAADEGARSPGQEEKKRPNLAGELLLCCKLLEQLVAAEPKILRLEYEELAGQLRRLKQGETARLRAKAGDPSFDRSEAVKRLYERLLELTKSATERRPRVVKSLPQFGSSSPPAKLRGSQHRLPLDNAVPPFRPYLPTRLYEPASPGYSPSSPQYSPVGDSLPTNNAWPAPQHAVYSEVIVCHPSTRSGHETYTEIVEMTYGGDSDGGKDTANDVEEPDNDEFNEDEDDSRIIDDLLAKWTTVATA